MANAYVRELTIARVPATNLVGVYVNGKLVESFGNWQAAGAGAEWWAVNYRELDALYSHVAGNHPAIIHIRNCTTCQHLRPCEELGHIAKELHRG